MLHSKGLETDTWKNARSLILQKGMSASVTAALLASQAALGPCCSFAILTYVPPCTLKIIQMLDIKNVVLVIRDQAESQDVGLCNIRGLFIRRQAEPRSRTSSVGRQKLDHLFPWNCLWHQARRYPECDRHEWVMPAADAVLRPQLGISNLVNCQMHSKQLRLRALALTGSFAIELTAHSGFIVTEPGFP